MTTETANKEEIISEINSAVSQLRDLMSSVANDKVNTVPYEGSWTAPQLIRHVTKSIAGMAGAMKLPAKPADRGPGERIPELKKVFLDFNHTLKSPEFIVPESGTYEKEPTIASLNKAFDDFIANAEKANLNELAEGLPLGPITKLEILHFVLYHTQRHLHQMKKICAALEQK